uniref:Peptidase S1 domain-containing protein n=1 Tax=Glossina pallidipes TaxID=7398 RepID=A0A1A9Z347_GLOPL
MPFPSDIDFRIVGGEPVTNNQFPWQVALLYEDSLVCGGSIISPDWVLTAAHCIFANVVFTVRAGSNSYQKNGQTRKAKRVIINKRFNIKTMDCDIALIRLRSPFTLNTNVQPISVAKFTRKLPPKLVVSGWGLINETSTTPSNDLMSVTISPVIRSECQKIYGKSTITKNMLCAAAPKKDACIGDSGGPLFFGNEQFGIVSFGVGCARHGYPGVARITVVEFLTRTQDKSLCEGNGLIRQKTCTGSFALATTFASSACSEEDDDCVRSSL